MTDPWPSSPRARPADRHALRLRRGALLILLVGLALAAVQPGPLNRSAQIAAQEAETRTLALDEGWNLVGWTGPDTPFLDAVAAIVDQTEAAATFDGRAQAFRNWNASAPALLNSLIALLPGEAVWLRVSEPVDWVQPVVADPDPLALHAGFNLVTWMGPSGLEPGESFAGIAAALNAAFAFDSAVEAFTSFGPSRPGFLNDLTPLVYGDGFWALMDAAATWSQPSAPEPAAVSLPDGSVRLEILRGALPPGVQASDITITDSPDGPRPIVEGAEFLRSVQLEPSGLTFAAPASLSVRTRLDPGAPPFAVLLSAERGVEFVPGATIAPDPEAAGGRVVTFAIDHFSWAALYLALPAMFEVDPFPVGGIPIGALFTPRAAVTRLDFAFEITLFIPDEFVTLPGGFLDDDARARTVKQIVTGRPSSLPAIFGDLWSIRVEEPLQLKAGSVAFLGGGPGMTAVVGFFEKHEVSFQPWRCLAPGRFSLLAVGDAANTVDFRIISFREGGTTSGISTNMRTLNQKLPTALITGECEAPPGFFGFISDAEPESGIVDVIPFGVAGKCSPRIPRTRSRIPSAFRSRCGCF